MAVSESVSRGIVNILIADLARYIDDTRVVYEKYRVEPTLLEPRTDIPMARVALYEDTETAIDPVNGNRMNLSNQTYLVDVSVVRSYENDKANRGELVAMDICDMVKEWARAQDFGGMTGEYIYDFKYMGSSRFIRNTKYATRTLTFVARRDLYKEQELTLGEGFPYTFPMELS